MGHIVLLGDSIFDNARYVPGRPAVIDQLRQALPKEWRASLLAVDGHTTEDVPNQLKDLPTDATHLFVSAGGNDALGESGILREAACTVGDAMCLMHDVRTRFQESYRAMLRAVRAVGKPTVVCTVYDSIPSLAGPDRTALAGFNEIILREAFAARLPVIDLRLVCQHPSDYSHVSPIEPSVVGGAKIVRAIVEAATTHDFGTGKVAVYV
jgi:hypothetical protein